MPNGNEASLLGAWRSRTARIRAIHGYILLMIVLGFLAPVVTLASATVRRFDLDNAELWIQPAVQFVMLLGVGVFAVARVRRARLRANDLGIAFPYSHLPHVIEFVSQLATILRVPASKITIRMTGDTKASPAQIVRTGKKSLLILITYGMLVSLTRKPKVGLAILWHEAGHALQWDVWVGYWTVRFVEYVIRLNAILIFPVVIGFLVAGWQTYTEHGGIPVEDFDRPLRTLAVCFLSLTFFFVARAFRHSLEFNADLLAVLAGGGAELPAVLRSSSIRPGLLDRIVTLHPSPEARSKAIERFMRFPDRIPVTGDSLAEPFGTRLYFRSITIWVLPLWLLLATVGSALTGLLLELSEEDRSEPPRPIFWDRAPFERMRISMYLTTNLTIIGGQVGAKDVKRYLESQGWRESERTEKFLRLSHPDYSRTIRMPVTDKGLTRSEVCALVALANLDEDPSMKAAVVKCFGSETGRPSRR